MKWACDTCMEFRTMAIYGFACPVCGSELKEVKE